MAAPCGNCDLAECHFCKLARRDPRYAILYGREDALFAPGDCSHRGEELGRVGCESCGGNVQIKTFACAKHGVCSLEKDVGHRTCQKCPDRQPFDLQQAYDWHDLGRVIPDTSRKFNGSLLRYRGQLVLATRQHTQSGWSPGKIILSRVDDNFRGTGHQQELEVNSVLCALGVEDPRLFVHRGELHVAFTGVQRAGDGMVTHVLYARLDNQLRVAELFAPHYPARQAWEKNWGFFSAGDQLYAVYDIKGHKILRIDGNRAQLAYESPQAFPPLIGIPRGGAAPWKRGNEFYSFFHDIREEPGQRREYNLCLYTFEDRPPFRVNRIARQPLFSPIKKHLPNDWTPHVVFPCGAFLENNLWHVSAGYYDQWSWLLRFDVNRIEELLDREPQGRDGKIECRAACLSPHQAYDVWRSVYNLNEYELPDSLAGQVVIDIGGHIGSFSRLCLDRGASRVTAYEPLAENAAAYRHNLASHANWTLVEAAAFGGEPPASATMGGYSLQPGETWDRVPVPTIRLPSLQCDLLKIDVEGAEYEILANADLQGVRRIVGEGHLGEGLPDMEWLERTLATKGFTVRTERTGPATFLFFAERS